MERFRLASVRELDDFVERYSEFVIVDVRPEEEYHSSHIRHAVNIPYEEGEKWNLPREKKIVVYCERGATSMAAARQMWRQGYYVISVAGGISEYRGSNLVFSR